MALARQRIWYSFGLGFNLSQPSSWYSNKLVLEPDGRARLERRSGDKGNGDYRGRLDASDVDRLWAALEGSSFPDFPRPKPRLPGGSSMTHNIMIGEGPASARSVYIDWDVHVPGYDEACAILASVVYQLLGDVRAGARNVHDIRSLSPDEARADPLPLSLGTAFLLAARSATLVSKAARRELLDRYATSSDDGVVQAVAHTRTALENESTPGLPDGAIQTIAGNFGIEVPDAPRASAPSDELTAWLTAVGEAVRPRLTSPALAEAWRAGEADRFVAVCIDVSATVTRLWGGSPQNAELRANAEAVARDLEQGRKALETHLQACGLSSDDTDPELLARRLDLEAVS